MHVTIEGIELRLETDPGLFSPTNADKGSLAMLSWVTVDSKDKVLDLGCGYGLVGLYIAKKIGPDRVVLCDIDPVAVEVARDNAKLNGVESIRILLSDGFDRIEERDFTMVLCNPPYHVDFSVPKRLIEGAFQHLAIGGSLTMVVKRLKWYENKMRSVFGGVRVGENEGYYILQSEKRDAGGGGIRHRHAVNKIVAWKKQGDTGGTRLRVVGISGSPRRGGNTEVLLAHALGPFREKGWDVAEFNLSQHTVSPCTGCEVCSETGECPIEDDMASLPPEN